MPQQRFAQFPWQHHDHGACIDGALKRAEQICRERGMRLTPIRRLVLESIWQGHKPVGAYEILDQIREGGRVDPPTVYRALGFLLEGGLIHRIESLNAYTGCRIPGDDHAGQFLICASCRNLIEIDDPVITETISRQVARLGFQVERQMIELQGVCPACQKGDDRDS